MNDSVFGVSIENSTFSNASVFKSLHCEQRFQMSPFSIASNGKASQTRRHSKTGYSRNQHKPIVMRTMKVNFNNLNPLNKNLSEADTGGGSYIAGFIP